MVKGPTGPQTQERLGTSLRHAPRTGSPALVSQILGLQRSAGNRVARIQCKLMVGSAYDPAERQADEIAHHVMRQLGSTGTEHVDEFDQPGLQRAAQPGGAIGLEGGETSPELARSIESQRGSGRPLPDPVLRPFESAFGTDLSGVRVHSDSQSAELNRAVSARAFTIGSDIFLGAGQYRPASRDGQELLAHEVTHTIQQRR